MRTSPPRCHNRSRCVFSSRPFSADSITLSPFSYLSRGCFSFLFSTSIILALSLPGPLSLCPFFISFHVISRSKPHAPFFHVSSNTSSAIAGKPPTILSTFLLFLLLVLPRFFRSRFAVWRTRGPLQIAETFREFEENGLARDKRRIIILN